MRHNGDVAEERRLYADNRPYTVPDTLDELAGPTSGRVTLPKHLDWSEQGTYNLDEPAELGLLYEVVLREAMDTDDLRRYLDAGVLRRIWRRLFLPGYVHRLWEERFPELRPDTAEDIPRPRTAGWAWTRSTRD